MRINEEFIQEIAQRGAFEKGKNYYSKDLIIFFDFGIFKNKFQEDIGEISAVVESDKFATTYEIEVNFGIYSGGINYSCDCPAYKEAYGSSRCCKHIVAVLLKYIYDGHQEKLEKKIKLKQEVQVVNDMFRFLDNNTSNISKVPLKFDITLKKHKTDNKGYFEFKVGTDRTYVVKNIIDFAKAIKNKKPLGYGSSFILDMNKQRFQDADLKIIDIILEYAEIKADIEAMMFYSRKFQGTDKRLIASNSMLIKMLKALTGKVINFSFIGQETNYPVKVVSENLPIKIDINESNEEIAISKSDDPIALDKEKTIYLYNDKIYIPNKEQALILGALDYIPKSSNNKLRVKKDQGESLLKVMIPRLDNNIEVNITGEIKDRIIKEELTKEIYLDKVGGTIVVNIVFNYGVEKINPLKLYESDFIVYRDLKQEKSIINRLEALGFKGNSQGFLLDDEESIIKFVEEGIEGIKNEGQVFYSDAFKNMKIHKISSIKSSVRINNEDLLEISFDIPEVDKKELKGVFEALREKKRYYKLKDGAIIILDNKELSALPDFIDNVGGNKLLSNGNMVVAKNNILYVNETMNTSGIKSYSKDEAVNKIIKNIKEVNELDFEIPTSLEKIMREYQKVGFRWFKTLAVYGMGGILADEMGLGKTLQSIAFLASEKEKGKSLVVAPTSLIYNWEQEIIRFCPELKAIVIAGDKKSRLEAIKEMDYYDVIITSYPTLTKDMEIYEDISFEYMIIDEAQKIKNRDTLTTKAVKDIKAKIRFALTGTPIENSLTELWSIFDFVMPGYIFSHRRFSELYEVPIIKNGDNKALDNLNKKIKPFILRRLKSEVIKELPEKIEKRLYVDMTKEQKKLYFAYVKHIQGELDDEVKEKGFNNSKIKILAALTRLRQICCDPASFLDDYKGGSGKYEALSEVLAEVLAGNHKVLLFSQFTSVLKNIEKLLTKNKITYKYLDGSTKSQERLKIVDEFNNDDSQVFLISLKAGGTGLNLTGADVVIHFDPWWNPSVENQATDRAHRIGQKNTVEVIKLISKGTIEEKIEKLQRKKTEVIKNVLDEDLNSNNVLSSMSYEEIKDLFL
ncbi:SNF2-related protein [Clostridium cellulovorans 743B]|uniref:SNF2-related protein n=1 Tax=Clostridium cellulovorans (strain ATCC 35296 / DSM 3052 / OCM 3 / 743B) TaxID=573061 RepID=D9SVF6_CLOC7|nr:SNF2-related protein [Clostridium cellulovorans 743B]